LRNSVGHGPKFDEIALLSVWAVMALFALVVNVVMVSRSADGKCGIEDDDG